MIAFFVFIILAVVLLAIAGFRFLQTETLDGPVKIMSAAAVALAIVGIVATPYVNVWQKGMAGKAQMAEAESNRQITVREAQAKKDSAELLADAEVLRATGVAQANRIVADGLGGPEGYLRYLYIQGLQEAKEKGSQIIYVPTEAGLPILEAGRLNK